jgi:TRAP-type uncharacterized transport system fused permease subunit
MLMLGGFLLFAASLSSLDQRTLAWCVSGTLAASALYVFLEFFFVRVEFDEMFIYPFSPWRGSRRIPWSDVTFFHFSATCSWYVIHTRSHGTLRVSELMSGIGSFVRRLNETQHA